MILFITFWPARPLFFNTRLNPWPAFGCKSQKHVLSLILPYFSFFMFFKKKTWQKHILASIWHVQDPNTGQNIQQIKLGFSDYKETPLSTRAKSNPLGELKHMGTFLEFLSWCKIKDESTVKSNKSIFSRNHVRK